MIWTDLISGDMFSVYHEKSYRFTGTEQNACYTTWFVKSKPQGETWLVESKPQGETWLVKSKPQGETWLAHVGLLWAYFGSVGGMQ